MSFHAEEKRKSRCPLFSHMVRSERENIFGICCESTSETDEELSLILKYDDLEATLTKKRIFCDDALAYQVCPVYKALLRMSEITDENQ